MGTTPGIKVMLHPVSDLAAAKAVYTALLGMEPQNDSEYYVGYDTDTTHVGLVPAGPQSPAGPTAYWEVDDIEAAVKTLTGAGATIGEAAHNVGGSRLIATVTDLDGNVLGLLQDQ